MSFNEFVLRQQYEKIKGLGDRLNLMREQINWKPFIPLVQKVFHDNKETGGRPHTDELVIVRTMLLQSWYGLSDEELEFQCHDRLSFRNFLGYPDTIPDFSTIWKIRERLKDEGVETEIWDEMNRQLRNKGYVVKHGVIQDATFIEADVGKKRYYKDKQARKRGKRIRYTANQKRHIDQDGSFSVKRGQIHYGYKNHIKIDVDHGLIRKYDVTTASVYDGNINLLKPGDKAAYRDKGYFGKGVSPFVKDMTMKRAVRGRKLTRREHKLNQKISKIRAPGERPFSLLKRVFRGERTCVKTLERVKIKEMFKCFAFNLYQLVTLKRKELAIAL